MSLDRESLIQRGWPMERLEYVGRAVNLDAFNFRDVKTGIVYSWTMSAVERGLEIFTEAASIVECGICVDSSESTETGTKSLSARMAQVRLLKRTVVKP